MIISYPFEDTVKEVFQYFTDKVVAGAGSQCPWDSELISFLITVAKCPMKAT